MGRMNSIRIIDNRTFLHLRKGFSQLGNECFLQGSVSLTWNFRRLFICKTYTVEKIDSTLCIRHSECFANPF